MIGYRRNDSLPNEIRAVLPPEAQDVYRLAFNNALAQRNRQPADAAWAAVARGWEERDGKWVPLEGAGGLIPTL